MKYLKSFILLSTMSFFMVSANVAPNKVSKKPNIIFVLVDDLGYGDIGCYGQELISTPSLDRMAAEGMRFTQHYSGSTVCAPSRCALLTGKHTGHAAVRDNQRVPGAAGFGGMPLGPSEVTVAQVLKQAGYDTAIIGKWDLAGPDSKGIPNQVGFDYSFGYLHSSRAHNYYPDFLWRNGDKVALKGNQNGQGSQYTHDLFTQEAMAYLEQEREAPFFMYLAYTIPHAELVVPEDSMEPYLGKFPEKSFKRPESWKWQPGRYYPQEHPKAAFAGMISRLDRDIGSLFTKLKETGLDRNTLVIFTSDNGPHREGGAAPDYFNGNGPLRGLKRDLYEGGIRVPFIAHWPGKIEAGTVNDHISASWDMLPTFAALADVATPKEIDGISMVSTLLGCPDLQEQHKSLYWEFQEKQALRMGDWKAVRVDGKDSPLELYNLKNDIEETQDLSERHPKILAEMRKIMEESHTDPGN
jgi:arylsulfatase A-like enzyme